MGFEAGSRSSSLHHLGTGFFNERRQLMTPVRGALADRGALTGCVLAAIQILHDRGYPYDSFLESPLASMAED